MAYLWFSPTSVKNDSKPRCRRLCWESSGITSAPGQKIRVMVTSGDVQGNTTRRWLACPRFHCVFYSSSLVILSALKQLFYFLLIFFSTLSRDQIIKEWRRGQNTDKVSEKNIRLVTPITIKEEHRRHHLVATKSQPHVTWSSTVFHSVCKEQSLLRACKWVFPVLQEKRLFNNITTELFWRETTSRVSFYRGNRHTSNDQVQFSIHSASNNHS